MKRLLLYLTIFVCVFAILAVGVTNWCIVNKNRDTEETVIDLHATYDQNDLLVEHNTELYNDVEIEIPKIKGLKDASVQDKINQDIYQRATEAINNFGKVQYSNYYTYANFANVISISFYLGNDDFNEQIYFNYNLVDGSRLKLEDLFLKDADILSIVRSAFYNSLVMYGEYEYDGETYIASPDENTVYKVVKAYINGDKDFAFSPSAIYFYEGDYIADVSMIDIYDKITVYSKYLTDKSLYTGEYEGFKNLFTCSDGNYDMFDKIEYGYMGENLWYDITVWKDYIDEELEKSKAEKLSRFKEEKYTKAYDALEEYKLTAQKNPDKFYIVLIKPNVSLYTCSDYENDEWITYYSDMADVYISTQLFEMPISLYDEVYKDKIAEGYRYRYFAMRGGLYLDTDETDGAVFTETDSYALYNYITGEELTELEDVFYPDSNYMDIIEEELEYRLKDEGYYGYGIDDATLTIRGTTVNATIPDLDNFSTDIYFGMFDKESMKLFN